MFFLKKNMLIKMKPVIVDLALIIPIAYLYTYCRWYDLYTFSVHPHDYGNTFRRRKWPFMLVRQHSVRHLFVLLELTFLQFNPLGFHNVQITWTLSLFLLFISFLGIFTVETFTDFSVFLSLIMLALSWVGLLLFWPDTTFLYNVLYFHSFDCKTLHTPRSAASACTFVSHI